MHSFDEQAAGWDTPVHVERAVAVAAAIRAAVPMGPATRVLEIGAGTGLLGRALAPHAGSVVLADASAGMIDAATAASAAIGAANIRTVRFDLVADALPAERFDLVASLMAMHHVRDTDAALARCAALLDPGGFLAIADLEAEDGSFHADAAEQVLVVPGYDRADLRSRAEAAGFTDVRFQGVWEIPKNGRIYPLFLLVARRP